MVILLWAVGSPTLEGTNGGSRAIRKLRGAYGSRRHGPRVSDFRLIATSAPPFFIGFPALDYISRRSPRLALRWCPLPVSSFSDNLIEFGKEPPPSEIRDVLL